MCHVVWQVEEKIKQTHRKYLLQEQLKIIKKVTEAVFTLPQFWRCRPSPSPQAIEMKGEWSLSPFYFSVIKTKQNNNNKLSMSFGRKFQSTVWNSQECVSMTLAS